MAEAKCSITISRSIWLVLAESTRLHSLRVVVRWGSVGCADLGLVGIRSHLALVGTSHGTEQRGGSLRVRTTKLGIATRRKHDIAHEDRCEKWQ